METIEERAYNAFCGTTSCRPDNNIYRFCKNCQHDSRKDAYIKGATEQRKIDIDKACEVYRKELKEIIDTFNTLGKQLYNIEELGELISLEGSVKDFRKVMEEGL